MRAVLIIILSLFLCQIGFAEITSAPVAPTLLSPSNGSTVNQSPTLTWRDNDTSVVSFKLYISYDSLFSNLVGYYSVQSSNFTINGLWQSKYYWRVISFNRAGDSSLSVTRTFFSVGGPTTISRNDNPHKKYLNKSFERVDLLGRKGFGTKMINIGISPSRPL